MNNRRVVKVLSLFLAPVLISILLTGYVFADEIKVSSDAIVSGTAIDFSVSANNSPVVMASAKKSIKNAKVTGVKNKVWTGKSIKQSPVVQYEGHKLKKGTDYTISYSNNKNVGTAKMTIKGKGKYSGSVTKTFSINPKSTAISTIKRKGSKMTVIWKKVPHQVSGYQLAYSGARTWKAKLSHAWKIDVGSRSASSKTIGITADCIRYRVWIRSYKKVGNKKYYSEWSEPVSAYRNGSVVRE